MEHPQAYRKRYRSIDRSRSHLCYFSGGVTVTVVLTVVSVCGNDRTVCEKCSVFMCRAQRVVLVASAAAGVERTDGGHPRRGSGVTTYNVVYTRHARCVSDIMQYRVEEEVYRVRPPQ